MGSKVFHDFPKHGQTDTHTKAVWPYFIKILLFLLILISFLSHWPFGPSSSTFWHNFSATVSYIFDILNYPFGHSLRITPVPYTAEWNFVYPVFLPFHSWSELALLAVIVLFRIESVMVKLILNIWPLASMTICPIMSQICQSRLTILPNKNKLSKICLWLVTIAKVANFALFGHTERLNVPLFCFLVEN